MIDQFAPFEESVLTELRRTVGADAEEILQRVYIRVWERKIHVRNPGKYLRRACMNAMREFLRSEKRRREYEKRALLGRREAESIAIDDEKLKLLTEGQRRVACLVAVGFSIAEAAEYLGISPGAARTRLYEARKFFKGVA